MGKTYSTKQVASLLRVDEETVRRWIRTGKLKGDLNRGKKGGFRIDDMDLYKFVETNPKYQIQELTDSYLEVFAMSGLDQRIFELEELIGSLQHNLEELIVIRDMLKRRT